MTDATANGYIANTISDRKATASTVTATATTGGGGGGGGGGAEVGRDAAVSAVLVDATPPGVSTGVSPAGALPSVSPGVSNCFINGGSSVSSKEEGRKKEGRCGSSVSSHNGSHNGSLNGSDNGSDNSDSDESGLGLGDGNGGDSNSEGSSDGGVGGVGGGGSVTEVENSTSRGNRFTHRRGGGGQRGAQRRKSTALSPSKTNPRSKGGKGGKKSVSPKKRRSSRTVSRAMATEQKQHQQPLQHGDSDSDGDGDGGEDRADEGGTGEGDEDGNVVNSSSFLMEPSQRKGRDRNQQEQQGRQGRQGRATHVRGTPLRDERGDERGDGHWRQRSQTRLARVRLYVSQSFLITIIIISLQGYVSTSLSLSFFPINYYDYIFGRHVSCKVRGFQITVLKTTSNFVMH